MSALLGIVIPVYNEGANIREALIRIFASVKCPYDLYLVYDFDEDNTIPVAKAVALEHQREIVLLKNKFGRGALNAIKTGLAYSESQYVVVTMADLADPPEVINDMVRVAEAEECDVVCGSRYMKGGSQTGGPLLKKTLSRLAGVSLHYLAGLPTKDATNSYKLYRKSMLSEMTIESTGGFEVGLEIVVKSYIQGFRIAEVPTSWVDRSEGNSRFRLFAWMPKYLKWYFKALTYALTNDTARSQRKLAR